MEKVRKFSRKRQAILDALRSTKEHPTAEMLYIALKPDYPELSLGTVYRNLALFLDEGEIISVGVVGGQERYDADTAPHAHLVCLSCGRLMDASSCAGVNVSAIAERENFELHSYRLELRGVCDTCRKREQK